MDILEKAVDKIKTLKEENEQLKSKIDSLPPPGMLGRGSCDLQLYYGIYLSLIQEVSWSCITSLRNRWWSSLHSSHSWRNASNANMNRDLKMQNHVT